MTSSRAPARAVAARGRPRSARARRAVLAATRALVEKGGYAAATIEAIAARCGVPKTTIYRAWPTRPALVVDLLMEMAGQARPSSLGAGPAGGGAPRNGRRMFARHQPLSDTFAAQVFPTVMGGLAKR